MILPTECLVTFLTSSAQLLRKSRYRASLAGLRESVEGSENAHSLVLTMLMADQLTLTRFRQHDNLSGVKNCLKTRNLLACELTDRHVELLRLAQL